MKVALVMPVVHDLGASGGAERFFADLHEYFARTTSDPQVTLLTSTTGLKRLQAAGRLISAGQVTALDLGSEPGLGRAGALRTAWQLTRATRAGGFDLVHICLASPVYVPYVALLRRSPRGRRPRVCTTVIDCTLAHSLDAPPGRGTYERQVLDAHLLYERWAQPDGIYSWYEAFVEAAARRPAIRDRIVRAARYCFTDPARFRPAGTKQPVVVFAGRLSAQKRPLLFVDAVAALREREPDLVRGWRFEMYGGGVLHQAVCERISARGLDDVLTLTAAHDMAPVFARSRLYVSTQAVENFTSLAMLEAMASGNAVIAEDVGQTREFVRAGENGLLVDRATPESFAGAMAEYLRHPEWHDRMAAASRALTTDVHTVEHAADDIVAFWRDVLAAPRTVSA